MSKLIAFLTLARVQTAGLTSLTGVFGILAAGGSWPENWSEIIAVIVIGWLMHIHGFTLNEIRDADIDAQHPELQHKPLVSGKLTPREAWYLCIWSAAGAYMVGLLVKPKLAILLLLVLCHITGAIYNWWGKRFAGSDFFLATWALLFCLYGAGLMLWPLQGWGPLAVPFVMGLIGAVQVFFNNAIEGGLKDAHTDPQSGVKSLVTVWFKARVEDGRLIIPESLQRFCWFIKGFSWSLMLGLFIYFDQRYSRHELWIQAAICAVLFVIMVGTLGVFLRDQPFERSHLKRKFAFHEMATFLVVPVLLWPIAGTGFMVFMVVYPMGIFIGFNRLLYGTWTEPGV